MEQQAIELLLTLEYTAQEIEEMSWIEVHQAVTENDYRYCGDCGKWVHTDIFNGESELCDDCI